MSMRQYRLRRQGDNCTITAHSRAGEGVVCLEGDEGLVCDRAPCEFVAHFDCTYYTQDEFRELVAWPCLRLRKDCFRGSTYSVRMRRVGVSATGNPFWAPADLAGLGPIVAPWTGNQCREQDTAGEISATCFHGTPGRAAGAECDPDVDGTDCDGDGTFVIWRLSFTDTTTTLSLVSLSGSLATYEGTAVVCDGTGPKDVTNLRATHRDASVASFPDIIPLQAINVTLPDLSGTAEAPLVFGDKLTQCGCCDQGLAEQDFDITIICDGRTVFSGRRTLSRETTLPGEPDDCISEFPAGATGGAFFDQNGSFRYVLWCVGDDQYQVKGCCYGEDSSIAAMIDQTVTVTCQCNGIPKLTISTEDAFCCPDCTLVLCDDGATTVDLSVGTITIGDTTVVAAGTYTFTRGATLPPEVAGGRTPGGCSYFWAVIGYASECPDQWAGEIGILVDVFGDDGLSACPTEYEIPGSVDPGICPGNTGGYDRASFATYWCKNADGQFVLSGDDKCCSYFNCGEGYASAAGAALACVCTGVSCGACGETLVPETLYADDGATIVELNYIGGGQWQGLVPYPTPFAGIVNESLPGIAVQVGCDDLGVIAMVLSLNAITCAVDYAPDCGPFEATFDPSGCGGSGTVTVTE